MPFRLVRRAAATAAFVVACFPARAQSAYQIPWRDIPASRCTVVVEPAIGGGQALTLKCKGRIDVLLTICSAERCAP